VTRPVKDDEPTNPCDVGLLRPPAVVPHADFLLHAIQEPWWRLTWRRTRIVHDPMTASEAVPDRFRTWGRVWLTGLKASGIGTDRPSSRPWCGQCARFQRPRRTISHVVRLHVADLGDCGRLSPDSHGPSAVMASPTAQGCFAAEGSLTRHPVPGSARKPLYPSSEPSARQHISVTGRVDGFHWEKFWVPYGSR
jgi:hypothetical protein